MNLDLYDIEFQEHDIYHCSTKQYESPSYAQIDDARSWSRTHHNSVLGLWGSTFPNRCSAFGPFTYRVDIKPGASRYGITYEQWYQLGTKVFNHHAHFIMLREFMLEQKTADILYVTDASRCVGEIIIVNLDCIERMELVTPGPDTKFRLWDSDSGKFVPHTVIRHIANSCSLRESYDIE